MTIKKITASEGGLLNLLYEISPLEWRKYQQRYPEVWADNHFKRVDRSGYPPFLSFRFAVEDDKIIERLKFAIESYLGRVSWILSPHRRSNLPGVNWTLRPSRVSEINEQALKLDLAPDEYLARYEPEFGPIAYDDLEGLTEHIRQAFHEIE